MKKMPKDSSWDAVIPVLLWDGYNFISKRCEKFGTDLFETRILFRRAVCLRGERAAKTFYDENLFARKGAAPRRILRTLLGFGGIHSQDDRVHKDRKEMFMALMQPEALERLSKMTEELWEIKGQQWIGPRRTVLFREAQEVLCRAICRWSGIPLDEAEVQQRTHDLAAMVDSFGGVGLRYWRGRQARLRTEAWVRQIIQDVRDERLVLNHEFAAATIALHRDFKGKLLDTQTAAVELINVIRPTLAVAYFIVFAAHALHFHPECRERLQDGDETYLLNFVQEVRRFYPFAPALGAIARKNVVWDDYLIPRGRLTVLDIYGTNHDPHVWNDPHEFRPERFVNWNHSPFNFIPNGGGDFFTQHRCAGEWITIEQLKIAVRFLTQSIDYEVPEQDLGFSMIRIPTFPKSGFVVRNVEVRARAAEAEEGKGAGGRRAG